MSFFVYASTAVAAALSGQYVGMNPIPVPNNLPGRNLFPWKGQTDSVAMGLTFDPATSMAHVEIPIVDSFNIKRACKEIPYTLVNGVIKFSPSAKCLKAGKMNDKTGTPIFEGPTLKLWLDLEFTYETSKDEITVVIPEGFKGWPDLKTKLTWTLAKPPKLAGAVFEAKNEIVDGSAIDATIKFNADGTVNFTIPQLPMSCPHVPYLAAANGGLYMAIYMSGKQFGMPNYHVKHDCVGKALYANDAYIYSMKFNTSFTKIIMEGVIYGDSSSSSSSSSSDSSDSDVDSGPSSIPEKDKFVFVLDREDAPKTAFQDFWAKALHF